MRQFFVLCAAALLAMGVSSSAQAIKVAVGATAPSGVTTMLLLEESEDYMGSVTYAKETLLEGTTNTTSASDEDDETTYYNLMPNHHFALPLKRSVQETDTGQSVYVIATLKGMVFRGTTAPNLDGLGTDEALLTGGTGGQNMAAWSVTTASLIPAGTVVSIQGAALAMSEGGGSISVEIRDGRLSQIGLSASESHASDGAIVKAAPALKEDVMAATSTPTARASMAFMGFGPNTFTASLGTIQIGVKENHRNAQDADGAAVDALVEDDTNTHGITVADNATDSLENPLMITGSAAFVGEDGMFGIWTAPADDDSTEDVNESETTPACTTITDILVREEGVPTGTTKPQMAGTFAAMQSVCIMTDGETSIPETAPFMVQATYEGLADAAFPPMGASLSLSGIDRDGASFRLPYLTTNSKFAQRLVIVNRGSATTYEMADLHGGEGVTVTAGSAASGDLPTGQTTLMISDIVTISGGHLASGTLSIVADKSMVNAALTLVNRETQALDTEHLAVD